MFEKQPWMQRAGEYPQSNEEYFGLLARAVFSAGLGPKVVESRWGQMAAAFHGFDPAQVERMDETDVLRLENLTFRVIKREGRRLKKIAVRREAVAEPRAAGDEKPPATAEEPARSALEEVWVMFP